VDSRRSVDCRWRETAPDVIGHFHDLHTGRSHRLRNFRPFPAGKNRLESRTYAIT
jgi:hypothetical protein